MTRLDLEIAGENGATPCVFPATRVVNAGYVGRDEAAVRQHIEELKREGVAPPPSIPMLFPVLSSNVTTAQSIETIEPRTSGEVEYVLLLGRDRILVGIGSDHTDRRLEGMDIVKSKQACPNVLGRTVWDFKDVRDHWDHLTMHSWVRVPSINKWVLYQSAALSTILPPPRIVELVRDGVVDGRLDGMVIFSGTIPVLDRQVIYGSGFRCSLADPVRQRTLECSYDIVALNYLGATAPPGGLLTN